MLSVVTQDGLAKYDINNYCVEGNIIMLLSDQKRRDYGVDLASYKTHEEAVWVFRDMIEHENSGGLDHVYILPTQERVEAELRMRNRRNANE